MIYFPPFNKVGEGLLGPLLQTRLVLRVGQNFSCCAPTTPYHFFSMLPSPFPLPLPPALHCSAVAYPCCSSRFVSSSSPALAQGHGAGSSGPKPSSGSELVRLSRCQEVQALWGTDIVGEADAGGGGGRHHRRGSVGGTGTMAGANLRGVDTMEHRHWEGRWQEPWRGGRGNKWQGRDWQWGQEKGGKIQGERGVVLAT